MISVGKNGSCGEIGMLYNDGSGLGWNGRTYID